MKLIPACYSKKVLAMTMVILVVTTGNARVFWNKVDAMVANENIVTLNWNVTEYNNKSFLVQHSVDGIKWETIAVVDSKNSPQSMTDYSYTHKNKLSGKQYYRIKDIDIDVSYTGYSPVKTLMLRNDGKTVSVWPNPATDHLQVVNNDNNVVYTKATIANLFGKVLMERKLSTDVNDIPVNQLSPGMYILKIESDNGTSTSQKFIKQ